MIQTIDNRDHNKVVKFKDISCGTTFLRSSDVYIKLSSDPVNNSLNLTQLEPTDYRTHFESLSEYDYIIPIKCRISIEE